MKTTEKIFYENPHITDFTASVLDCIWDDKKKSYRIVLDRTAFFPEEGGQNADSGILEMISQHVKTDCPQKEMQQEQPYLGSKIIVTDVQIKQDIIYHYAETALAPGCTVTGQVNWEKRFDYMQQHTGEHIISGLVAKKHGFHNVGFHLGDEEVTLDFDGMLTLDMLREIELLANEAVWRNLPVSAGFPSAEALVILPYRSKIEIAGDIRIVEIPGYDICACCAPHVDTTGQIGLIKITGVQSHRGGVRVNILCGSRALADYTSKQDSVTAISVLLSAKPDAIADAVVRIKEDGCKKQERINSLQTEFLRQQIAALPSSKDMSGENVIIFTAGLDTIAMRSAVNELCLIYEGYCGIFAGEDAAGYHFIVGSASKGCLALAAILREKAGSKCGGSEKMIQGSVPINRKDISDLFETL